MSDYKCKLADCLNTGVSVAGYCSHEHRGIGEARGKLALQREFDAYKRQVREEALAVAAEQNWCDEGLNAALERLGLEPRQNTYDVDVTFTATRAGVVRTTASNEDVAFETVNEMSTADAFVAAFGQAPSNTERWRSYTHAADQVDQVG
jgi:hypothetical protein